MAAEITPTGQTAGFERGKLTLSAAAEPGDVLQYHDGRACYVEGSDDLASGDQAGVVLSGEVSAPLTDGVAAVRGMPAFWDESANAVVAVPALHVGDFFLGVFTEDKAGGTGVRAKIELNRRPAWLWSLRDGSSQGVGDEIQETLGLGVTRLSGGSVRLAFDAVSESATASVLSGVKIPVADNLLFHAIVNVVDNGAAAHDIVIGLANDDHATDPDLITESVFVSINGASLVLNAESDDGTTEVAATSTTKNYVVGTPFAVWIDARAQADVQIYIDGVLVLGSSTFTLAAATGPVGALAMAEKTTDATAAQVDVLEMGLLRIDDATTDPS